MNTTLDLIIYISSGLLATGVLVKTVVSIARFFRRVNTLVTQWIGNPDLGIPGMVDRMEDHGRRLGEIEEQLKPKAGKTLRERLDIAEREIATLKRSHARKRPRATTGTGE